MDASRMELSPAASRAAAWRYIWRATSTSVAISASRNATPWCSMMGLPNASRSRA